MGRVINNVAMTVDGVIDVSDWFVGDGEHDAASRAILESSEAMLLGRKTYEGLAGYWKAASGPWAEIINPMPKYVLSRSTLGELEWNATQIEGDGIEGVRSLKEERDGDFFMSGCGELARELIQAGLVDELHFWIHPRIQGPGTRPYEAATIPVRLLDTKRFDSGVTFLRYEPTSR
jgi:dihydrofolate reductase